MSIEAMKRAKGIMANARDWFGNDPQDRWDEDEVYHELVDAVVDLNKSIAEAEKQERFFCERCGKRLSGGIHTCTPPAEAEKQEPVAWRVHPFDYGIGHEGVYAKTDSPEQVEAWKRKGWNVQPLYTHPPKREPLTDDEFTACIETAGIPVEDVELVWAIKDLVEAAHGITGE